MRSGMEASRFELVTGTGEQRPHVGRERQIRTGQLTINIEHAKPDALHMKRGDRAHERFTLLEECGKRRGLGRRFELGDDLFDEGFRGLTMIRGHASVGY